MYIESKVIYRLEDGDDVAADLIDSIPMTHHVMHNVLVMATVMCAYHQQ